MRHRGSTAVAFTVLLAFLLCGGAAAQSAASTDDDVWITTGKDFFDALVRSRDVLSTVFAPKAAMTRDDVVVTRVPARDLDALSRFGHEAFNRCSGFIVHKSQTDATAALRQATAPTLKTAPADFVIDQQTTVSGLLPLLDKTNILSTISHLSTAYNNRYYKVASGRNSALWIRDLWLGYANGRSDVTVETYAHSGYNQPSVILTVHGATLASEIIVIGGHLDSIKSGNTTKNTIAPGADDNASGIATISEVIRVLLANGFVPDRTVKFMGYAAEEVGLWGSGDIAEDHLSTGADVVAVLQLDMTDFNGSAEDIALIDDFTNPDLSTFIGTLIDEYQPSLLWTYTTCGYGCSDHASWHNRGFAAAMPFEARFNQHNQLIHTSDDSLTTLGNQTDHALKFAKLALSFAVETGMGDGSSGGCTADAECDDGLFCNGVETCNAGICQSGSEACPGAGCDEVGDVCVSCLPSGASCAANSDCCSDRCRGKNGSKTCS